MKLDGTSPELLMSFLPGRECGRSLRLSTLLVRVDQSPVLLHTRVADTTGQKVKVASKVWAAEHKLSFESAE